MRDLFGIIFILVMIVGLPVGFVVAIGYISGAYQCAGYERATGRPTKYVAMACYGNIDGQWYDTTEFNARFNANRVKLEK